MVRSGNGGDSEPMRRLQRDGVALFHVEAGSASPPLLLVHGWCCDHAYFAPQFEHFVDKQYRVVAVALRNARAGQADSDRAQHGWDNRL